MASGTDNRLTTRQLILAVAAVAVVLTAHVMTHRMHKSRFLIHQADVTINHLRALRAHELQKLGVEERILEPHVAAIKRIRAEEAPECYAEVLNLYPEMELAAAAQFAEAQVARQISARDPSLIPNEARYKESISNRRTEVADFDKKIEENVRRRESYRKAFWQPWAIGP